MTPPIETKPQSYRFGVLEIVLSTMAVLALFAVLFFALSTALTFVIALAIGADSIQASLQPLLDEATRAAYLRSDPVGQAFAYLISFGGFVSIVGAVWIISSLPKRMPFYQRIAFLDWSQSRDFWALQLFSTLIYPLLAGFILRSVFGVTSVERIGLPSSPVLLFLAFLVIVVIGPLGEEIFFRGWLYTLLRSRFSFITVWLFTSALFSVAHFDGTGVAAVFLFPISLVLGYVRERYGSIKASALFHCIYNLYVFAVTLIVSN